MGTLRINRTKPVVMNMVITPINGISIIGLSAVGVSVKPKKPLSKDSKIIT